MDTPRHRIRACIAACSLLASLAGADGSGVSIPHQETPIFDFHVERSLVIGALLVPPLDICQDPAAAAAVAEVRMQMTSLMREGDSPWAMLLAQAQAMRFVSSLSDDGTDTEGVRVDFSKDAATTFHQLQHLYFKPTGPGDSTQVVHGVTGYIHGKEFLGLRGESVYGGSVDLIGLLTAGLPAGLPACQIRTNFQPGVQALIGQAARAQTSDPLPMIVANCLPDSATMQPSAITSCTPGGGSWSSSTIISGTGRLPLHPLDARLGAAAAEYPQILLAVGGDRPLLTVLATLADGYRGISDLCTLLQQRGTGDVLVQAGWSTGVMPDVSVVALVDDPVATEAGLKALAKALAKAQEWEACSLSKTVSGWHLICPLGLLTATVVGSRLVFATSDAQALTSGTNDNPNQPWAAGDAISLQLDLPQLGGYWLPMAYKLAHGRTFELGTDPLSSLDYLAWFLNNQGGKLRGFSQPETSYLVNDHHLEQIFPKGVEDGLTASVAVYHLDPAAVFAAGASPSDHIMVMRLDTGFRIFDPRSAAGTMIAATDMPERLKGYLLESGPVMQKMPVVVIPPRATFSERWLPPLATTLAHLAPYQCSVQTRRDQLEIHERGLPLMALVSFYAGLVQTEVVAMDRHLQHQRQIMINRQPAPATGAKPKTPRPLGF